MIDISQLNLLMPMVRGKGGGQRKTPGDVGESLFRDFLTGNGLQSSGKNKGLSIAGGKGPDGRGSRDSEEASTPLAALDETFRYLGGFLDKLRLPGAAAEQLARFLEKQGFSREDIDRLILASTDKDGMIRLGRLMSRLQNQDAGHARTDEPLGEHLFVSSGNVPEVESMFMEMGLDIGKVKEMIESALDSKGDLILGRLTDDLAGFMPGNLSEEQLSAILASHGIKSRVHGVEGLIQDPDIQAILKGFSETSSQDFQKQIKQDIARLLREKGVPPQEVKSFLENLSVKYSGSLLKAEDQSANAARAAITERDATHLLNQVVITSQKGWGKGGVHEKIMDILKQENLIGKNDLGRACFQEETPTLRPNMVELMKHGDQKVSFSDLQALMSPQGNGSSKIKAVKTKVSGPGSGDKQDTKVSLGLKDASGNEIHATRAGKINAEIASSNDAKNTQALPHPLPKIVDRMIWMLRGGEQRGSLHISPPELGKLDLDLVIRQGHLQANLNAENPAVKEIIEANLNQLKQQLQDQGFVVDKFSVTVGQDQQRSPEDHLWARPGRRGRGSERKGGRIETDPLSVTATSHSVDNPNQIDVRV